MVIPTLAADAALEECLGALEEQTFRDFEVVVVDNSGKHLAGRVKRGRSVRLIENDRNLGFGAAINQGMQVSGGRFLATLNDDAAPSPGWLAALVRTMAAHPEAGMCASRIRLAGTGLLDSAGMLICADGSSKQRGHGQRPEEFDAEEEVLFPSACAALYRRQMLEETGGFDESFFLYSEDADLGLRARWAGWRCIYVPDAIVDHRYSHTAGRASALKAYLVERNRLYLIAKNFPAAELARVPPAAMSRYFWHWRALVERRGTAGRFREEGGAGWRLPYFVLRAHLAVLAAAPRLLSQRRRIRRTARISGAEFRRLLRTYSIRPREVAAL